MSFYSQKHQINLCPKRNKSLCDASHVRGVCSSLFRLRHCNQKKRQWHTKWCIRNQHTDQKLPLLLIKISKETNEQSNKNKKKRRQKGRQHIQTLMWQCHVEYLWQLTKEKRRCMVNISIMANTTQYGSNLRLSFLIVFGQISENILWVRSAFVDSTKYIWQNGIDYIRQMDVSKSAKDGSNSNGMGSYDIGDWELARKFMVTLSQSIIIGGSCMHAYGSPYHNNQ